MKIIRLCAFWFASLFFYPAFSQSNEYAKIELSLNTKFNIQLLNDLALDIDHLQFKEDNTVEFLINYNDLQVVEDVGFKYEVTIPNYRTYYNSRAKKDATNLKNKKRKSNTADHFGYGSMGGFYTFNEVVEKLDEMYNNFPNLATPKFSIGTSIEGRDIWAIKISDNPNISEVEDVAYFDALHHAREPLSMAVAINFAFWLLENYSTNDQVKYLIDNREIYIVPCVNPDGYEYNRFTDPNGGGLWRKNRRNNPGSCYGVDLNRNYSFGYAINNSCSSTSNCSNTYRGTDAFSEPETIAVKDFIASINPKTAFSIHSTAGNYLMPYGYNSSPPQYNIYAEWASDFLSENDYPYGTTYEMLGYTSCGTTRDYLHSEGIYGWTPEIDGSGFWPFQSEIFDLVDENVYPLFYQAWIAGQYMDIQSHSILGNATSGNSFQMNVEVKNKGVGTAMSNVEVVITSTNTAVSVFGSGIVGFVPARSRITTQNLTIEIDSTFQLNEVELVLTVLQDGVQVNVENIVIPIGSKTVIFEDDAESGPANWISSGTGHQWGINQDDSYNGSYSFGDSDDGNSINNTLNYFTQTTSIDLSNTVSPYLEMFAKWSLENGDSVNLNVSTNNGASWSTLKTFTLSEPWHQQLINLSSYKSNQFKVQFSLYTDDQIPSDGFYFDKLSIADYDCLADYVNTSNTILTDKTIQVQNVIETNHIITDGSDVHFKAANYIRLLSGFSVKANANFKASNEGCE